jgi:hypothetical protein
VIAKVADNDKGLSMLGFIYNIKILDLTAVGLMAPAGIAIEQVGKKDIAHQGNDSPKNRNTAKPNPGNCSICSSIERTKSSSAKKIT